MVQNSAWLRSVDREYNDLNSKSQEAAQELKLVQMKILDARSHLSKLQKELDGKFRYYYRTFILT
jgi:DNA repair protein RAD50